jgi:hypothetical protein
MKNHNFILMAALAMLIFAACKPTKITLPGGGTTSIEDTAKVYWVHKDGNQTKVKVFQDFPKSEASYPQYDIAARIPKQSLKVTENPVKKWLVLEQGLIFKNQVGTSDEQMGLWIIPDGNYYLVLTALSFSCVTTRIEPSDGSWIINGIEERVALRLEAHKEYSAAGGATVVRQVIHSPDDARTKGTIVVLTDNFKESPNSRPGCTEETYLGCNTTNYGCLMGWNAQMANPDDLTVSNPSEANIFRKAFDLRGVNITLSCEYLSIACCASRATRKYNVLSYDFNLWIGQGDTIGYIAHQDVPDAFTECGENWEL